MQNSKKNLALIFGGRSTEHEVSLVSAYHVAKALEPLDFNVHFIAITKAGEWYRLEGMQGLPKAITSETLPPQAKPVSLAYLGQTTQLISLNSEERWPLDVAFPVLHGNFGEDGTIQGYFKMMNLPFVGCDVLASAMAMDKEVMKRLLLQANLPTARYRNLRLGDQVSYEELVQELAPVLFLKPANAGSSVGVHKIRSQKDLDEGLKDAFRYDDKLIIEEAIQGRELEVAVLGHRDSASASLAAEVHPHADFYSYHAKYVDPNGASFSIPADLSKDLTEEIQALALSCYQILECEGLARVDFFYNEERGFFINELNTLPGFTPISAFPKLWTLTTYSYSELVDKLIHLAFEQHSKKAQRLTHFELLGQG